jgi:hypothetical protein
VAFSYIFQHCFFLLHNRPFCVQRGWAAGKRNIKIIIKGPSHQTRNVWH